MVEKPFGTDLSQRHKAERDNASVLPGGGDPPGPSWLGLESVENLLLSASPNLSHHRAAPGRRTHVASIQITMAEDFDVGRPRGSSLTTKGGRNPGRPPEPPTSGPGHAHSPTAQTAGALRTGATPKSRLSRARAPSVRGPRCAGSTRAIWPCRGVAPGSTPETFAAIRLTAQSWRWDGVPILIRAGKCMPPSPPPTWRSGFASDPMTLSALATSPLRTSCESASTLMISQAPSHGAGQEAGPELLAYSRAISPMSGRRWRRPQGPYDGSSALP